MRASACLVTTRVGCVPYACKCMPCDYVGGVRALPVQVHGCCPQVAPQFNQSPAPPPPVPCWPTRLPHAPSAAAPVGVACSGSWRPPHPAGWPPCCMQVWSGAPRTAACLWGEGGRWRGLREQLACSGAGDSRYEFARTGRGGEGFKQQLARWGMRTSYNSLFLLGDVWEPVWL